MAHFIAKTRLNILVVDHDTPRVALENVLDSQFYAVLSASYGDYFLTLVKETAPDVIVFNLDSPCEKLFDDLQVLNKTMPIPVVMFAKTGSQETIAKAINVDVSALIFNGFDAKRVADIIQVALARFKQQQALKSALDTAVSQLEDRKLIDRAKAILIRTQNFSENEAYHTLRKLAMDRNITLGEMSRNVIAMAELLK